ncbi:MAG TPA: hypothetical protein VKB24_08685 [Candidatus Acidoferrum sp.]|nr:hypothetical protein [Candidatus Acidoferrum sp.]
MNVTCKDRERIFLEGTPEEWSALAVHAAGCAGCREEVAAWTNLSVAASELHQEWDSPALWPRIERALEMESRRSGASWRERLLGGLHLTALAWQTAAAALLLVLISGSAVWMGFHRTPPPSRGTFLSDRAVRDVEKAETAYEQAIDKLDAQARLQLDQASTPLLASYREKLQVLDSAIADLKAQAGVNPANGHLRRQLLAMYKEKQETLEEVLEAKQ